MTVANLFNKQILAVIQAWHLPQLDPVAVICVGSAESAELCSIKHHIVWQQHLPTKKIGCFSELEILPIEMHKAIARTRAAT